MVAANQAIVLVTTPILVPDALPDNGASGPKRTRAARSIRHASQTDGWSYQTFVESRVTKLRRFTASPPLVGRLEFFGADAAKVAVPPGAMVESIDVVSAVRQRGVAARIDPLLDTLRLQAAEERLDHGIVPAVALAAHARLEVIGAA
jgi:hypothetical protein